MTRSERLEEIRKRAEAATPGPWVAFVDETKSHWAGGFVISREGGIPVICQRAAYPEEVKSMAANARLMAAARSDIPWLLREVARLSAALHIIQNHTTEAATDEIAREALKP